MDWFPTFCAAGNQILLQNFQAGKSLNRNYLWSSSWRLWSDWITYKRRSVSSGSKKWILVFHGIITCCCQSRDYKYTFIVQPWRLVRTKSKLDWPGLVNIRLDPFEKMSIGQSLCRGNWWAFWILEICIYSAEWRKTGEDILRFSSNAGRFKLQSWRV